MAAMPPTVPYPVRFEVDYPAAPSRWLILLRWILAIPQLIVVEVLQSLAQVLALVAFVVILFTRQYPEPVFKIVVGATRWQYNVLAYILFHDAPYPPFSFDDGVYPHLRYDVARQLVYHRWLPLVKWLLALPHYVALAFLGVAAIFAWLAALVAVVATGRFPLGIFNFLVGVGRWNARVTAYLLLQVDRYPPFSLR
jgi:hypothetical protein